MDSHRPAQLFAVAALALAISAGPPSGAVAAPARPPAAPGAAVPGARVVFEPIAAPRSHFTHGWVTATVYFDKGETRDASDAAAAVPACLALAAVSGPAGPAFGAACAVNATAIWFQSHRAERRGMCLKVKMTWPVPSAVWPDIYQGSDCR